MARNTWNGDHLDVVTEFLNPEIGKVVYAGLPEGIDGCPNCRGLVPALDKALYGFMQAPRLWHQSIDGFLLSIGFLKLSVDHNVVMGALRKWESFGN